MLIAVPLLPARLSAQGYQWTNFAGMPGGNGNADATGSAARFTDPGSVAVDGSGNVYVADTGNSTIRKITSGGVVTTLAGSVGNIGVGDGTGSAARFTYPRGVAADGSGNVYVADAGNHPIRKITSGGMGTTLAGDATLGAFFTPALSDARQLVARATVLSGKTKPRTIYVEDGVGVGALPAYQTGKALDENGVELSGATFKNLLDPVTAPGGTIAFAAKLAGPKAAVDEGAWSDVFSPAPLEMRRLLAEGGAAPGFTNGERLKSVTSLSLRDDGLLVSLKLTGPKSAGVTAKNDQALVLLDGAQSGTVLLREGTELDGFPNSSIESFSVLQPALGSAGQGRWHGNGAVLAKVTLADETVLLVSVAYDGTVTPLLSTGDAPSASIAGFDPDAKWKSFGLPAMGCDGLNFAPQATLLGKTGTVTAKDDSVLLFSVDGVAWELFARKGELTPISAPSEGPRYASFFDPITNEAGQIAFLATLQGTGVSATDKTGLFCGNTDHLRLAARLGTKAPDEAGAETESTWSKFISYALPSGTSADIVFLAETKAGDTTAKNKLALWGADSTGKLRRLLRTGAPVVNGGPELRTFTLLTATPGAYGTARSYNKTGSLAVLGTFADKTQALLRVDVP